MSGVSLRGAQQSDGLLDREQQLQIFLCNNAGLTSEVLSFAVHGPATIRLLRATQRNSLIPRKRDPGQTLVPASRGRAELERLETLRTSLYSDGHFGLQSSKRRSRRTNSSQEEGCQPVDATISLPTAIPQPGC